MIAEDRHALANVGKVVIFGIGIMCLLIVAAITIG